MREVTDGPVASWSSAWNRNPEASDAISAETAGLGWIYVSRLSSGRAPTEILDRLASLGERDARFLRLLRFVASSEVKDFVSDIVPKLLPRLPQSVRSNRSTVREVRGRIDWGATVRERIARGVDPTLFVVSRVDKVFDVPANRVLTFLLERVAEAATEIAVQPNGKVVKGRQDVATLGREASRLRSAAALAGVPSPPHVDDHMRQALRSARISEFREEVSALVDLYDGVVLAKDANALRKLVGERVWLPKEPERIFELWSLFMIATSLEKAGWRTSRMRLLGSGRGKGATFVLARDNAKISLHYQSVPQALLDEGRYTPLLEAYGISGGPRRPDIVVTVEDGGEPSTMIVEVKLTDDRRYLVDAIYKAFGYLADFAPTIGSAPPTRAALVVWGGLTPTREHDEGDDIAILDVPAMRKGAIMKLIEAISSHT